MAEHHKTGPRPECVDDSDTCCIKGSQHVTLHGLMASGSTCRWINMWINISCSMKRKTVNWLSYSIYVTVYATWGLPQYLTHACILSKRFNTQEHCVLCVITSVIMRRKGLFFLMYLTKDLFFKQKTSAIFRNAYNHIPWDIAAALHLHVDISCLTYSEGLSIEQLRVTLFLSCAVHRILYSSLTTHPLC